MGGFKAEKSGKKRGRRERTVQGPFLGYIRVYCGCRGIIFRREFGRNNTSAQKFRWKKLLSLTSFFSPGFFDEFPGKERVVRKLQTKTRCLAEIILRWGILLHRLESSFRRSLLKSIDQNSICRSSCWLLLLWLERNWISGRKAILHWVLFSSCRGGVGPKML